jgi:hypothetical protein
MYIVMQILFYYGTSIIFAFFMLFSEPSGDALSLSVFGLLVCLLIESLLILEEMSLQSWLFQYHTSHDVVSFLRRLFPAFMNGCRCITGAFQVDKKAHRLSILTRLNAALLRASLTAGSIVQDALGVGTMDPNTNEGVVAQALRAKEKTGATTSLAILERASILTDPVKLKTQQQRGENFKILAALRNIVVYVMLRYVLKNFISYYDANA